MFDVVGSLLNRNLSWPLLQRWLRPARVGRHFHAHRFQHEVVASGGLVLCALSVPHCHCLLGVAHAPHSETAIRHADAWRDGTRSLPATIFRSVEGTLGGSSY